jgi:ABC-type uncharacterized transport system auxiliary subunit
MNNSRTYRAFIVVVITLLLSACTTSPPVPDDHYYRLTTLQPEQTVNSPKLKGVLKVDSVKTYGIYRERALLFSRSEQPEELQQHRYHYWIDTPSRLIRDQLVDFLRSSKIADSVAGAQLPIPGDQKLKVSLKQFERVIGESEPQRVRVTLEVLLISSEGDQLMTGLYQREIPALDQTVSGSVRAFNQALNEIYRDILKDLQTL